MAIDFSFRLKAVGKLTTRIGAYILTDLDDVPIYVGQSTDGIRARVQRHLTSARSDVIANRQLDVWEIAYVWEYPVESKFELGSLEAALFHHFNSKSRLINGSIPASPPVGYQLPDPTKKVQVLEDAEIEERKKPELRLPRQAKHYSDIVGHFLFVKNSKQMARTMDAHFERLTKYHATMLGLDLDEE
jgi:hypothetical protein